MTKLFYRTVSMFGLMLTGPALAAETKTMTHEGVTYVYSVTDNGRARIIEGLDTTNNRSFRLRVARGWVEGRVDGTAVLFSLREVKPTVPATASASMVAAR